MLFMCLRIIFLFCFVNTIFRKFAIIQSQTNFLKVSSSARIRKNSLHRLWQRDHHLEQVTVRDDLHIALLQLRQTLGNGQPQSVTLHMAGSVPSGESFFQLLR